MALVFQDVGLTRKLNDIRAAWNTTKVKMHLYKNNYTPLTTSVLADFTEADFAGYAAQDVSNWAAASIAAHVAKITADPLTFTRSSTGTAQDIYGYYITDSSGVALYWSERDSAAPRTLTNSGDSLTITPQITDQTL